MPIPPEFKIGVAVRDSYCSCEGTVTSLAPLSDNTVEFMVTKQGPTCMAKVGSRYCMPQEELDVLE